MLSRRPPTSETPVSQVEPKMRLWVVFDDRLKFGDGRARLLEMIDELGSLKQAVERFKTHTAASAGGRRRARAEYRVRELLAQRFTEHVENRVLQNGEFPRLLDRIASREIDPYSVVDDIIDRSVRAPREDV